MMQLVGQLNVLEPSTEEPIRLERWFRRPRRITLQREDEALRRQLAEPSRELAELNGELARFGSLRDHQELVSRIQ